MSINNALVLYGNANGIRLFEVSKSTGFKYKVQVTCLKSSHETRSKVLLSNSKSLLTNLFSNNRSMVKLIQNYKKLTDPINQTLITTDQLIQLLIQLVDVYLGSQQDVTEEEVIEVLQNYTSLHDLIARCLGSTTQDHMISDD